MSDGDAPAIRVVRLEGPARLPEALGCIHAAFGEYQDTLVPPSAALNETVATLGRRLADGAVFLAEAGEGEVLGAVCAEIDGDAVYLDRLAVLPDARRRGVAAVLVAAVEAFAAASGATKVRLGVRLALAGNIAMFERLGYSETGRKAHPGFSEPTSAAMAKPVGGW